MLNSAPLRRLWLRLLLRLRRPDSLRTRLLTAGSIILTLFFLVTAFALENAYRASTLRVQEDKLEGWLYSVQAAATEDGNGVLRIATEEILDPHLLDPALGVRAALYDEDLQLIWNSVEFLDAPEPRRVEPGERHLEYLRKPRRFSLTYAFRYIDAVDDPHRYYIVISEDARAYYDQLRLYRGALFGWLVAAAAGLLLIQLVALDWVLSPLRRLTGELAAIERGEQLEIRQRYPAELSPLTEGLNEMMLAERSRQTRYRNALGDLAHSLKTPMAVAHGILEDADLPQRVRGPMAEQLSVMRQITDYQLRKAATGGRRSLSEPVAIDPIVAKLGSALSKVYADRSVSFDTRIEAGLRLRADQDDLFELIGNLLDNACKYGGGQVRLSASRIGGQCLLRVEDNGRGFPEQADQLFLRGMRADTHKPGQGIGLAAVFELVETYEGQIELGRSQALGGGEVRVRLRA